MKRIFVVYFLLFFSNLLFSQERAYISYAKTPLDSVVQDLQDRFKIIISYNSKITENKSITVFKIPNQLPKILQVIEAQTGLFFTKIDATNYTLQLPKKRKRVSICGYVFDKKTKQRLVNVSIFQPKTRRGTTTNNTGHFHLSRLTPQDTIEIQLLGYKKHKLLPKDNFGRKCKSYYLKENTFSLKEIFIGDYLTSGFYKNNDGSIKAKPSEFQVIPELIGSDVLQSMQLIPGVQSPDESATNLNIRGGLPDQNLILWDGIKMYQYNHFFGMISSFNSNLIEDIRVFKNAALARYSNHLSGVIDIRSYHKVPKKTEAGFGTNMIYADAFLKAPIGENVAVILSARRSFSELLKTSAFNNLFEHVFQNTRVTENNEIFSDLLSGMDNSFYFQDFTAKVIARVNDRSSLALSSIFSKNELNVTSEFDLINRTTNEHLNIKNRGFSANWNMNWNSNFTTNLNVSYSNYNFDYDGKESVTDFFDFETLKNNEVKDFGIHFQTDLLVNDNHQFVNGYHYTFSELRYSLEEIFDFGFDTSNFINTQNSKNNSHSLFSEYHFRSTEWDINTGIRVNYFSNTNNILVEPRARFSKKINKKLYITIAGQKLFQPISQIIEFAPQNFGLENQIWALADNQSIPILESEQISLGANYKRDSWHIDVEAYHKRIKNLTSITKGFNIGLENLSIGKSRILGLDVLLKKKIHNFTSLISYSLTENIFHFDDINGREKFFGNFDIRHYLSLIQAVQFNNLELSLGWRFRTSTPYTLANGIININSPIPISIDYGTINGARLKSYHRLDFTGNYKFRLLNKDKNDAVFGFSLLNIYNRKNILNRTYRIVTNTTNNTFQLKETDKISIGITPNFVFRLNF